MEAIEKAVAKGVIVDNREDFSSTLPPYDEDTSM